MINILIAGDYSPKYRVAQLIEQENYQYILKEAKQLNEKMDYSIVNFESTIANKDDKKIEKWGPHLHCSEKSLDAILYAGFNMVTLANNHFFDYGDEGVKNTLKAIKKRKMDCIGGGYDLNEASKTFYKVIANKKFAFINCCEHEFSIATKEHGGSNPLLPIQQYYKIKEARIDADYVIVIVHGGHECFQLPSFRMKETYRFFIAAGADAVVNHHQHCFSGYEYYNGKPIVYGLGNFCFDYGNQNKKDSWYEGYALQLVFDEKNIRIILHPYIQCKENPTVHFIKDTTKFNQQLRELNRIINNDELLVNEVEKYYEKSSKQTSLIFEPFYNGLFNKLFLNKIFPSFLSKKRRLLALNYVDCESHLDKLKYALKIHKK